jgi:phage-related holin
VKDIANTLNLAFAAVGGYLGWFFGGWDGFLYALIAFVAADYVTGLMSAAVEKSFQARRAFAAYSKRCLFLCLSA